MAEKSMSASCSSVYCLGTVQRVCWMECAGIDGNSSIHMLTHFRHCIHKKTHYVRKETLHMLLLKCMMVHAVVNVVAHAQQNPICRCLLAACQRV